jgi:iron-sulfur cluster assembly protein|tara:strand:- start:683 stop:1060 length:378 start_codon:yes stop_codon:yes gene_type:complete
MSKPVISVTRNAFQKMSTIMKKSNNKNGFLFGVDSGGCNGFNFNLQLIKDKELNQIIKQKPSSVQDKKVKVYIEPLSELYLLGTEIDYLKEDYSKGIFESKFVYNIDKKLASTCGCGISFMPKKI